MCPGYAERWHVRSPPATSAGGGSARLGPGQRYRLQRGVNLELGHEILQVGADGVRGEAEPDRCLPPPGAVGQAGQYVTFPWREGGQQPVTFSLLLTLAEQQAQDLSRCYRGQPGLLPHDATDDPPQVLQRFVLSHPRRP